MDPMALPSPCAEHGAKAPRTNLQGGRREDTSGRTVGARLTHTQGRGAKNGGIEATLWDQTDQILIIRKIKAFPVPLPPLLRGEETELEVERDFMLSRGWMATAPIRCSGRVERSVAQIVKAHDEDTS